MTTADFRIEHDSMGELKVPAEALWGAQTQRAVENFPTSGLAHAARLHPRARADQARGGERQRGARRSAAADRRGDQAAALEVAAGLHDAQFPVDVFQTGSGTSSNMNANEVIATLAGRRLGKTVHPNDHVNMGQSSNDVIPTAIHVTRGAAAARALAPGSAAPARGARMRAREFEERGQDRAARI